MTLTADIPQDAEPAILELLARLEKARGLRDDESIVLEKIIKRQVRRDRDNGEGPRHYAKWTQDMDDQLLAAVTTSQKRVFRDRHKVTKRAMQFRRMVLRERGK
jgi:hypothetical protein